jgi:Protein of unknown function (DUF2628)
MPSIAERKERVQQIWNDTPWDDIATFIGPNAGRFERVWEKQKAMIAEKGSGIAWGFCWPAFFLSFVWFLARKQWVIGAVLIIIPVILGYLFPSSTGGGALGIALVIAAMAKSMYLQASMEKIAKIREANPVGEARNAALKAAGGINWPIAAISGAVLAFAIYGAFQSVMEQIEGTRYQTESPSMESI